MTVKPQAARSVLTYQKYFIVQIDVHLTCTIRDFKVGLN